MQPAGYGYMTIHWQTHTFHSAQRQHNAVDFILYTTPTMKHKLYKMHKMEPLICSYTTLQSSCHTSFGLYLIYKHSILSLHPRALCLQIIYHPHGCVITTKQNTLGVK